MHQQAEGKTNSLSVNVFSVEREWAASKSTENLSSVLRNPHVHSWPDHSHLVAGWISLFLSILSGIPGNKAEVLRQVDTVDGYFVDSFGGQMLKIKTLAVDSYCFVVYSHSHRVQFPNRFFLPQKHLKDLFTCIFEHLSVCTCAPHVCLVLKSESIGSPRTELLLVVSCLSWQVR